MEKSMAKHAGIVAAVSVLVAVGGVVTLRQNWPLGPLVFLLGAVPLATLRLAGRRFSAAVPDLIFGSLDTGLLVVPALAGGVTFGVVGAIAGSVIGDALTDAVAGFFEGAMAEWLRAHGFEESRETVTTALGKMAGCLLGSGLVLTVALLLGVELAAA
jgi:hypothetical protein